MFLSFSLDCPMNLGLQNYGILDSQISASSVHTILQSAAYARINLQRISGGPSGGWRADKSDKKPWIQVDFREQVSVNEIKTQGRNDVNNYVKRYTVSYSNAGSVFQYYKENGEIKVIFKVLLL